MLVYTGTLRKQALHSPFPCRRLDHRPNNNTIKSMVEPCTQLLCTGSTGFASSHVDTTPKKAASLDHMNDMIHLVGVVQYPGTLATWPATNSGSNVPSA